MPSPILHYTGIIDLSEPGALLDPRFVTLGPEISKMRPWQRRRMERKLRRERYQKVPELWATLGWNHHNKALKPGGKIRFSKKGNYDSSSITLEMVKCIRDSLPAGIKKEHVLERYIDLTEVDFKWEPETFDINKLPELRLTVFLNKSEGALVYYDYGSKAVNSTDEGIEFIHPAPTNAAYSTDRDRLDYFFPLLPPREAEALSNGAGKGKTHKLSNRKESARFVIKVLTFKRGKGTESSTGLIRRAIKNLSTLLRGNGQEEAIPERYRLLMFHAQGNYFHEIKARDIDPKQKTLLLVHGTFSDTHGSYGGLFARSGQTPDTFLSELMRDGIFEQIIAFDHRTVFDDGFTNAEMLKKLLGGLKFAHPIAIMGSSRGGVLAYLLATEGLMPHFKVDKVLTISGAFGVGYLDKAQKGLGLLNAFRKINPVELPLLVTLAQHSAQWLVDQPGLRQITPGDKLLLNVIGPNVQHSAAAYMNIRTDWHPSIAPRLKGPKIMLDRAIRLFLGKKHDWVVGYSNQVHDVPYKSQAPKSIKGVHTQTMIAGRAQPDPRDFILGFF